MMRGDDVEELQDFLNSQGYDITVDGYYGNETADVVKEYQTSKGLGVDGVVGPNTRDEIMKDLGIKESYEIYFSYDTDKVYWAGSENNIDNEWQASDNFIEGRNAAGLPRESCQQGIILHMLIHLV